MGIQIKNWKLAILALILFIAFISLGCWQLSRGQQKKLLLQSFTERQRATPLSASELKPNADLRLYRATLTGKFDNEHTFLLDNKIYHGQIGYEVYTPFVAQGLSQPILIDRGFIAIARNRRELPIIKRIDGKTSIMGLLNLPPTYVALGEIRESAKTTWPLRVEFINLQLLSQILGAPLYHYVLNLDPTNAAAYDIEWQIVVMSPERHFGYALQWFAFALTLLILFVALNRRT